LTIKWCNFQPATVKNELAKYSLLRPPIDRKLKSIFCRVYQKFAFKRFYYKAAKNYIANFISLESRKRKVHRKRFPENFLDNFKYKQATLEKNAPEHP